jgi:1-aminocyclopropane-1-carboxylate deaminase/D-cysteine desulfhydrase-like pyridoxal-dependent ACC family enzyme
LLDAAHLRIVGIPVSEKLEQFRADVGEVVRQTVAQFRLLLREEDLRHELLDGFIGDGYAIPTPQSDQAMRLLGRLESVPLDPTYTAKAMAGFLHAIGDGHVRRDATPLFLHTGGIFGLMARADLFS